MIRSKCARTLLLSLVLVLVAAESSLARGRGGGRFGGRGSGRVSGNVPTGNFSSRTPTPARNLSTPQPAQLNPGNLQGRGNWQPPTARPQNAQQFQSVLRANQSNLQSAVNNWQSGPQPFSPAWYAQHPNAWHATHPYAGEAVVLATAATVAAWTANTSNGATTVVESGDTYIIEDSQPQSGAEPNVQAGNQQWLNFGTFTVTPQAGAAASRMIQLAVNRNSEIRGVLFDQLTGTTQNLTGRLDQTNNQATWYVEGNRAVEFIASVESLTSDNGTVAVRQAGGESQWSIERSR